MMAKVLKLVGAASGVEPAALEVDRAADLFAEREKVAAALGRYSRFDDDVLTATQARDAAKSALRDFIAAEASALRAWAETGDGEAPTPDREKRRGLESALAATEREVEAAEAARATVEPAKAMHIATLNSVAIRLDELRANSIVAEALRETEALEKAMGDIVKRHADILAARNAIIERGNALSASSNRGGVWLAAASRLGGIPNAIESRPSPVEISTAAAAWRNKIQGD